MMKMNFQKRCFLLVLCAFLLLPLLSLGVAATADPADVDEEGHVIWVLSENGNTLMGNGKTYKSYLRRGDAALRILEQRGMRLVGRRGGNGLCPLPGE